jgi:alpha/beta hydrolase fold
LVARFLLALYLCQVTLSVQGQVFDIPHQKDAPTRTLFLGVQNPKALVLLFPGGGGMPVIFDNGSVKSKHTFIRSLDLWAQYGIDAVLVDSPYNLGHTKSNLRGRQDHLNRVDEVVRFYKAKLNLPIWIFGHSMGSSTATYYANEFDSSGKRIAGIIIAGTISTAYLNQDVEIPVLGIHHEQDSCGVTPVSATSSIINGRPPKLISKLEIIEGGISEGSVCDSFAYHGFNQTEPELIKRAAQFILNQK